MGDVQDHYDNLLANHYTWMFGVSFSAKVAEQKAILQDALHPTVNAHDRGVAVDLGSGPGFQTIALAEMGYSPVLAVDISETLLGELKSHSKDLSVRTIHSDVLNFGVFVSPATATVIVCMGDTITHLDSRDAVETLLRSVFDALLSGGKFVLSYRDLSAGASGLDRFIPVYSDKNKTMTCFLEFDKADSLLVHDLFYSREGEEWHFEKSSYRKLRLPVEWLENTMIRIGFSVQRGEAGRLIRLTGQKG
jgi:SAM-dependent methyltransferase